MTRIIRSYIALMAVTLLLFSCAKDEAQGDSQLLPIQLTAAGLGTEGTVTRAANNVNTPTNFFDGTNYINFTVAVDGTNYTYKTNDVNVNMTSTSPAYFPVNGNSVIIKAYYPADKMQYASTAQTFTVEADQSTDANYKASDLMYGLPKSDYTGFDTDGKSVLPTTNAIPLEFVHKMVKITMNVTINGAVVKKITMKNIMRSIDFNPADGTLSNVAAVATSGLDEVIMYDNSTGTSTAFTCAAIIPEQNPVATTEFIDVVIQDSPSDKTLTYKLQEDGDFKSGKQYIYNLTVNNDEILCTTSITDWATAVDGANYTHGDGLAVLKNIKMNPLWYVAEYNLENTTSFSSSYNAGGYFTWAEAMTNFAVSTSSYNNYSTVGKVIGGEKWHLPTASEWNSIFPVGASNIMKIDTDGSGSYINNGYGGVWGYNESTKGGIIASSYWVYVDQMTMHAIRHLGTDFCSAWKYELLGGFSNSNYGYIKISATLIDKIDDSEEAAADWYSKNFGSVVWGNDYDNGAVQRILYARGMKDAEAGTAGRYWSTTVDDNYPQSNVSVYFLIIEGQGTLVMNRNGGQTKSFSVRLFRDN